MPLSSDPTATVPVYLDTDAAADEKTRPAFLARFLTVSESRRVRDLTKQAFDEKDQDKAQDLLNQILAIQYAGWQNVTDREGRAVPFEVKDGKLVSADDALALLDKWELVGAAPAAIQLGHLEKKRQSLLARSATEASAKNVATAGDASSPSPTNTDKSTTTTESPSPA